MDRLLCGDVGFGKTEVALRAVMKAVMDGKQVAIMVPTTVLAQQHYQTALARFSGFPVNIDVLSRFRTAAEQKKLARAYYLGILDYFGLSEPVQQPEAPAKGGLYRVQVGAFREYENALAMLKRVKAAGFEAFIREE